MTATTSRARCIFCGTSRSTSEAACPACGRTWIDQRVDEAASGDRSSGEGADQAIPQPYPRIEHDAPISAPPPPRTPPNWPAIAGVAAGIVAVYLLIVYVFLGSDAAPTAPTTSRPDAAATSVPTTTQAPITTTTVPATSTTISSSTTTTTTTTTTTVPPIEAIGEPIPLTDMTLGAFALGPFDFEAPNPDVLGRLVATFGQPTALRETGTELGLCPNDVGTAATWGGLTAVFLDGTLLGYRLEGTADAAEPTAGLQTLSGLRLGDTIADLRAIYEASIVEVIDIEGTPYFVLRRSTDQATLLWGPTSSGDEDGTILGIYSRRPCDRGPLPAT